MLKNLIKHLLPIQNSMMKKFVIALFAIIVLFAFVSCQKNTDQPASANDITGTWKFISIEAKTTNTQEVTDRTHAFKTVSVN